jgi:hypothetical protein
MISWSDWPARRRPLVSLFAAVVIAIAVAILVPLDPLLAALALVILLGLCAEALLPTRFTLSEDGVKVDSVFRRGTRPWERIDGWQHAESGFLLQGAVRVRSLRHRDVWLRCPEQLDIVEASLRTYLGEPNKVNA